MLDNRTAFYYITPLCVSKTVEYPAAKQSKDLKIAVWGKNQLNEMGMFRVVAWIHTNRYTLLTLQNRVITRSSRFKVSHNSHRTWWLHITNVQERDRGEYMCQINTVKMMKQFGYLEVV
ncbi:ig domain-containing protein, partial [Caerostris extrusa]